MDKCPNCGRTFLPDRLIVHLRSCNKAHGKAADAGPDKGSPTRASMGGASGSSGGGSGMGLPSKGPAFVKRPKTLACYIW